MPDKPTTGDAAAMREALEEISARIKQEIEQPIPENDPTGGVAMCEMEGIARAALAAPGRNCDWFGTAADALAAYTKDRDLTLSPEAQAVIWWLFDTPNKEEDHA